MKLVSMPVHLTEAVAWIAAKGENENWVSPCDEVRNSPNPGLDGTKASLALISVYN